MGMDKVFATSQGDVIGETDGTNGTRATSAPVDSTTDTTFARTIGRKADAAATAVGTTKSLVAMVKYIANLLTGARSVPGTPLNRVAASIRATAAGTAIVTATGTVFIKALHFKKITSDETVISSLTITSDDTVPLNLLLRKETGNAVVFGDFPTNASRVFNVGWYLATGKKISLKSDVDGQAAGYQIHVEAYALSENASLA